MGSMLLAEVQYKANGTRIRTLKFCYDEKGTPVGFVHIDASGTDSFYYYAKNLQGDVAALYRWNWSDEGKHTVTLEATYSYDLWGKLLSVKNASGSPISATLTTNIANVNPFRYRGYYYDTETGFYYLQSRYYDPTISRFINADSYGSTGQGFLGTNMFAYCLNNPIIYVDSEGRMAEVAILVTNYWNPLGWAAVAVLTVECVVVAAEAVTYAFETYSIAATAEEVETEVLTSVASVAITGVAQPPNNNDDQKPSFKKVSKHLLKKFGLDAHEIKREYLGKNAQISHYDLSYDTKTGIVYILTKAGEIVAKTYYNVFIDRPPLR